MSLPASCCALSLPKLVFFAWPHGAGGVGSEATSCVCFCCFSCAAAGLVVPSHGSFFVILLRLGEKGGKGAGSGGVGQCLDSLEGH